MLFASFLRYFEAHTERKGSGQGGSRRSQSTGCRLWLEPLEDRTLPSFGFGWAFNVGGPFADEGFRITTDASRNVYVTGYIESTVNFDPNHTNPSNPNNTLTYPGSGNLEFVAKYTSTSTFQWVTGLGISTERGSITVDGAGNVYVAGGDPSNNNAMDVFSLDAASGAVNRKVALSGTSNAWTGVAVGPSGDVYVTGTNASAQAFVAKLDPSGNVLWNQPLSGSSTNSLAVAVDSAEHVYVAYASVTTTTTGSKNKKKSPPPPPTYNIQVASVNAASGSTIWSGSMGKYGKLSGGIAVGSAGNVYVAGGGGVADNSGTVFVAKLVPSSNGALIQSWNEQFSGHAWASGVAVDGAGNVYTTGSFAGSVNFDPGPGTYILQSSAIYTYDVFLSKLDTNGNFVTALDTVRGVSPNNLNNWGNAIALDSSGNLYSTGGFRGTANFNPTGTYDLAVDGGSNSGYLDVFVSQLTQPPSAGGAAAPSSPHTGSKLAVLLAASSISLAHFVESSNPLQAAGGGTASQGTGFHPVVLDGGEFAPSCQPRQSDTGNAIPSPLPWPAGDRPAAKMLDGVFAEIGTELDSVVLITDLSARWIG
jgi:hypothetical protein